MHVHNIRFSPKGSGFAWEQAHFASRGHRENDVIAGTTVFQFALSRNDGCWYSRPLFFLTCQILNVEKNRLSSLPPSIGELRLLQTLNLKGMMLPALSPWGKECSCGLKSLFLFPTNLCVNRKCSMWAAMFNRFTEQSANLWRQRQQHGPAAQTAGLHPYSWGMWCNFTAVPTEASAFNRSSLCDHRPWHSMRPWWPTHLHLCALRVPRASSDSSALVRRWSPPLLAFQIPAHSFECAFSQFRVHVRPSVVTLLFYKQRLGLDFWIF